LKFILSPFATFKIIDIWNNIAETALSKEEEKNLVGKPASILKESAKNLRISEDSGKGSELCEILLYGIMKDHYSYLY
jgi:hypothetical protein